jgi:hypothetical protein
LAHHGEQLERQRNSCQKAEVALLLGKYNDARKICGFSLISSILSLGLYSERD